MLVHEQRLNERVGDEQALKETYDNRIGGRGGNQAREAFEDVEEEEEVDIHSTKLWLSVISVISYDILDMSELNRRRKPIILSLRRKKNIVDITCGAQSREEGRCLVP